MARVAAAADLVLVPLRPSILDIRAVDSTAAVVTASKKALLVLNACQPAQMLGDASATLYARKALLVGLGVPVAATSLAHRVDYQRALNDGEAVNEFAPDNRDRPRIHGHLRRRRQEGRGLIVATPTVARSQARRETMSMSLRLEGWTLLPLRSFPHLSLESTHAPVLDSSTEIGSYPQDSTHTR